MDLSTDQGTTSKPRRRRAGKAAARPTGDRVKVSIVLTADVDFKLSVAAAALRTDRSSLVNQLLAESPTLKRFVVQDRGKSAGDLREAERAEGQGGEAPAGG